MPGRRYRAPGAQLCAVKVKLTTGLAMGVALLVFAHSNTRRLIRRGEVATRGGVKHVWSSRGQGRDIIRAWREKISTGKGGLSQSPPFFFGRAARLRALAWM